METIWEELRERADRVAISSTTQDLLRTRRARVDAGDALILNWDAVKHSIGRA